MKSLALILCGLAAAVATPEWENFKATYEKSYANPLEEHYRLSVFLDKLKFIEEHNELYKRGEKTYYLKINKYSDLTHEEFLAMMTGGVQRKTEKPVPRDTKKQPTKTQLSHVDWREKGAVNPVKDQGQCGSCWAFSAVSSLESFHFIETGELVSLSEQNLVDCSTDYGNYGCGGGWPFQAYQYIMDNNGIDTEESYPYLAVDDTCHFDPANVGATVREYVKLPVDDEHALQEAVQEKGPVSVCIDASQESFGSYGGGVYYEPNCDSYISNHAVNVVGFGVEDSGDEYWIVRNSWGPSWGEEGYIKMARNKDNNCAIATFAVYPVL
ncbi:crustapain-like [Macrobrachium rosenbergii]|uniref:crustapain-like n=1 Tax=Macrobrachium rosenbergii TaxID=79674 RepID=UPI0034D778EA